MNFSQMHLYSGFFSLRQCGDLFLDTLFIDVHLKHFVGYPDAVNVTQLSHISFHNAVLSITVLCPHFIALSGKKQQDSAFTI